MDNAENHGVYDVNTIANYDGSIIPYLNANIGSAFEKTLEAVSFAEVKLLIDTSVWISVFRDRTGQVRQQLEELIDDQRILLTRFTQLELLQGSLNDNEWTLLASYLETQDYIEPTIVLDKWLLVFTTICAAKD